MAEKYIDKGLLRDTVVTDPGGNKEVVLLFPLPRRVEMTAPVLMTWLANGALDEQNLLAVKGKNGKAEFRLVGADLDRKVFLLDLVHDNVYEVAV